MSVAVKYRGPGEDQERPFYLCLLVRDGLLMDEWSQEEAQPFLDSEAAIERAVDLGVRGCVTCKHPGREFIPRRETAGPSRSWRR